MFKLIRHGDVYNPEHVGRKDILICNDKIIRIADSIEFSPRDMDVEIIDGSGFKVVPGFIDQHVHITGGGGEGGPTTRTPDIRLSDLTTAGITTAIGLLGTDGVTRSLEELLAKAKSLEVEGISTYIYTGCYTLPFRTLTGSLQSDIVLIDKIIGVGEIALSDHRSSYPDINDLKKLAGHTRVGGLLSNKAGIVHFHLGDGSVGLEPIVEVVRTSDIPIRQFIPTHVNRAKHLMEQSIGYIRMGGFVDLTSDIYQTEEFPDCMSIGDALDYYIKNEIPLDHVTASSDSNGSAPFFNDRGELVSIGIGVASTLFKDVRDAILHDIVSLEQGISLITQNPAKFLKLYPQKGSILEKSDADLVLLDEKLKIHTVIAKGNIMVRNYEAKIKGYFEK